MSSSVKPPKVPRLALLAVAAVVLVLGAIALERASRSWVPDAERRVKEAQEKSRAERPPGEAATTGDPLAEIAEKAAKSPQDAAVQLEYANKCAQMGAYMRATRPAEAAARLQPSSAQAQLLLGMLYATQGYLAQAEGHYRRAIALDPSLLEAYLRYGHLLGALKRSKEEEALYRKAMEIAPNVDGPRLSLAGSLADKGRHDDAIAVLEPLLAAPQPNPAVLLMAAKSMQSRGKVDRAEELLKKLLERKPDLADAHHTLGSLLSNRGATKEGVDHMLRACELEPENSTYWYALGNALRSDSTRPDALQKAAEAFERSLEINPGFPFAHYFYGLTLEDLSDREGAVREYRRTLELEPKFGSARLRLGAVYKAMGRATEGEKLMTQFAKEATGAIEEVHGGRRQNSFVDTAQAQYDRGMEFLRKGERQRAVAAFRNALDRDPQFGLARRQLRMMGEQVP